MLKRVVNWFKGIPLWLNKRSLIGLIILGIVLGLFVSPIFVDKPTISILSIRGEINDGNTAKIVSELRRLKDDASIKGIVLAVDSPGGSVANSEELYLDILETRKHKPIVASISGAGASGAYYAAMASNFIYVKPTSIVGSIGVIATLPQKIAPDETILTTGPFKESGFTKRDLSYLIQRTAESFYNEVLERRKGKLKIDREELAKAKIYTGMEALSNGMADDIGSVIDAVQKAASLAKITDYEVQEVDIPQAEIRILSYFNNGTLKSDSLTPQFYYLYLPFEK